MRKWAAAFAVLLLAGTGARADSGTLVLPPDIHSIAVRSVANDTEAASPDKLRLAIIDDLVADGRVTYDQDENHADAVLIPKVRYFRNAALGRDSNGLGTNFQMWVVLEVSLVQKGPSVLWTESAFQIKRDYLPESEPGGKSQDRVEEEIWKQFGADVVRRTLEGPLGIESLSPRPLPPLPGANR
jgi:hypothetical protein